MSRHAAVIQFLSFEDLGSLGPLLARENWTVSTHRAGLDDLQAPALMDADLLIVLGGPLGVHDNAEYPFLDDAHRTLDRRLATERATLGICLGGQLLAQSLGATVHAGAAREVGWSPLELTAAGRAGELEPFGASGVQVFHWHSDRFDPPDDAVNLAGTPACPSQAFSYGSNALALQFHPEVTARGLEPWYIGHTRELHSHAEPQVPALRADGYRFGPRLEAACEQFFTNWLARVTA